VTAGEVYRALWRYKWFILVLTATCVGAAWFATARQTKTYEASTLVRAQERGKSAGDASAALLASQVLAETYAKVIASGALAGEVRSLVATCAKSSGAAAVPARRKTCAWLAGKRRGRLEPRTIARVKLSANHLQDLDLLSITARSATPRSALLAAAAAPDALRRFIRKTAPPSERIVTVKAATVSSPVSRHLPLNLTIALMLGLIFSGAFALLVELFRDRLPEADELERALGHPVLATIPTLRLHRIAAPARAGGGAAVVTGESVDGENAARTHARAAPERRL
jgi:capsular polysaccharide biosynthesis protein